MKLLLILGLLITANISLASEQLLAKITSDETPKLYSLFIVEIDEETSDILRFHKDRYSGDSQLIERVTMELSGIEENGLVMEERDSRKIVKLLSDNFEPHNGGNISLDYLYNGATGKRKSVEFEILRNGDTWALEKDSKKLSHFHIIINKMFAIGVVGIKKIILK